jgi:hypothetical protein
MVKWMLMRVVELPPLPAVPAVASKDKKVIAEKEEK